MGGDSAGEHRWLFVTLLMRVDRLPYPLDEFTGSVDPTYKLRMLGKKKALWQLCTPRSRLGRAITAPKLHLCRKVHAISYLGHAARMDLWLRMPFTTCPVPYLDYCTVFDSLCLAIPGPRTGRFGLCLPRRASGDLAGLRRRGLYLLPLFEQTHAEC